MMGEVLIFDEFVSFNIVILVYFFGVWLNKKIVFLCYYNIFEFVFGGLMVVIVVFVVYLVFGKEISFLF